MIETLEANATHQQDTTTVSAKPRLLDQMRQVIRVKHYSIRTEKTYLSWVKQFIRWGGMRHPADMGAAEVEAFLSMLANQRDVAGSTQNQALAALLFLPMQTNKTAVFIIYFKCQTLYFIQLIRSFYPNSHQNFSCFT